MSSYNSDQIQADLTGKTQSEMRFGEYDRLLYSTDASMFKIAPAGVVLPKSTADIVAVVKYCAAKGVPVTIRGAGTGLAGGAINHGVILDVHKYMNEIIEVNADEDWVRVQPGLFQTPLNNHLKQYDKFFPPNPSSADYCTIGGMIGNNASGGKSVKYGATKQYVRSVELVLHNGDVVRTKIYKEDDPEFLALMKEDNEWGRINREAYGLIKGSQDLIKENWPDVIKNCCGYNLKEALQDGVFDINKLIVGSEGGFGIVTEATLGLMDAPKAKQSALFFFESLEIGGKGIMEIRKFGPSCCEIMAADFIELVKADRPEVATFMPDEVQTALLAEFEGQTTEEVTDQMNKCVTHLKELGLLIDAKVATDADDQVKLWAMRKSALPIIYNRPGLKTPVTFIEDCAIQPAKLPQYINGIFGIFDKHGVEATAYGHAGDGNIHVRPLMNLREQSEVDKLIPLASDVFELARSLNATYSGEHGDGRLRAMFLPDLFGPLYPKLEEMKKIWDPNGIMNPDRVINHEVTPLITHHRMGAGKYHVEATGTMIDEDEVRINIEKCHGCGKCRGFCPMLDAVYDERATPRAKVNMARALIYGDLNAEQNLSRAELKEMLDLCYNCKTCKLQCPTHVDTGLILQHIRNHYYENKGATLGENVISNAELLAKSSVTFNPISNFAVGLGITRSIMTGVLGVARERYMPPFDMRSMRARLPAKIEGGSRGKLAYFTGCYSNYYKTEDGYAFLKVMKHLGYEIIIPPQRCCAIPKIGLGNYAGVRDAIQYNVASFKKAIDDGYTPIITCPSCYTMFKDEMLDLNHDADTKIVAEKTREATDFLYELVARGDVNGGLQPLPMKVAYKNPCHANVSGVAANSIKLLKSVPELDVVLNYDTCCGMAGTFGMKEKNYAKSMTIAQPMIDAMNASGADTLCTNCGTCSIQMQQGTGKKPVSPMVLIAKSMGLDPYSKDV